MEFKLHSSITEIDRDKWQSWVGSYPFLNWHFLEALERGDCLAPFGWTPVHLGGYEHGELVSAAPLFIKTNTFGEFVFDGVWAEAYQRNQVEYYPKLVCAAPYSPATGPRLLGAEPQLTAQAIQGFCKQLNMSSAHLLFPEDIAVAESWIGREDIQFQWQNQDYRCFDDFLSALKPKKRKNIRQERRRVADQGIGFRWVSGDQISNEELETMHKLYASIYERKWGYPALSLAFYQHLAEHLGAAMQVCFAVLHNETIAMALYFKSEDCLYGRYWGCSNQFDALHFETCYYQGIEYAINNNLKRFEPGAQGEHKISRGFLATSVRSKHHFIAEEFHTAVDHYLRREHAYTRQRKLELNQHSPYLNNQATPCT